MLWVVGTTEGLPFGKLSPSALWRTAPKKGRLGDHWEARKVFQAQNPEAPKNDRESEGLLPAIHSTFIRDINSHRRCLYLRQLQLSIPWEKMFDNESSIFQNLRT